MKKIRVAINGFGRIGRQVLRIASKRSNLEVVAINDPFLEVDYAKYLLTYDTVHKKFNEDVKVDGDSLVINGKKTKFFAELDPTKLPWKELKIDVVIEASGKYTSYDKAKVHLEAGAKKVLVTAPGKEMPMFVVGVNEDKYEDGMKIVSNASCTTNGLAPLVKVINDYFGVEEAIMSTIHSVTATQLSVDGASKKNWRLGRAASANIIPSTTGAAVAVSKVIPELEGKITGMSFRVPTLDVSVVDLTCKLKKATTYEKIVEAIKKESKGKMKGILGITEEPNVSSDFIGDERSCIFDAASGIMLSDKFVKLVAWYDNEWGYSCRVVDLAEIMFK